MGTAPLLHTLAFWMEKVHLAGKVEKMERETRVELATSTLARSRSTTELLPLKGLIINEALRSGNGDRANHWRNFCPRPVVDRSKQPILEQEIEG